MIDRPHSGKVIQQVTCAVLTISDSRTPETDDSGALIRKYLLEAGHDVSSYEILPDEPNQVRDRVVELCTSKSREAILLTGGTGVTSRDTTVEALNTILDKRLDGFGELFRSLSFQEIGPHAILSRALAGIRGHTAIFAMPGSPAAVRMAMEKLIVPLLGHVAWLLRE
ncbi:MAG: molybdenum cofactor biosynthesis protein B [Planctomycetota bacterium]